MSIHDTAPTDEETRKTLLAAKLAAEWEKERRTNPSADRNGGCEAFFEREKRMIDEDATYMRGLLERVEQIKDFHSRVSEATALFEYLYDHPKLIIYYPRFRSTVWEKMKEIETEMLNRQLKMVSDLVTYDAVVMEQRKRIRSLGDLIENIRETYYMERSALLPQ